MTHATRWVAKLALTGLALCLLSTAVPAATITVNTLISEDDSSYDDQEFVVQGCTVTINGSHRFTRLHLLAGGIVTHSPANPTSEYALRLTITGELLIDSTSKLDVTGCGYPGNTTIGNTATGAATGLSGGSYGAFGFPAAGGLPNATYGDYRDPKELGSGGAGDPSRTGAGGGSVRIVANALRLEGAILAEGNNGVNYYQIGGPGSGGSVRLDVSTLTGNGRISANGGSPAAATGGSSGGRIAIYYQQLQGFDIAAQVTAYAGAGGEGAGGVGTIYSKPTTGPGRLLISSRGSPAQAWTPLGNQANSVFQAEDIEVSGQNVVVAPLRGTAIQVRNLSLLSNAVLTVQPTTAAADSVLRLTVTNVLAVDPSSRVDVTGCGYPGNVTLGYTNSGAATGLSGASYGGLGLPVSGSANQTYGDFRNPNELGSGGAGDGSRTGAGGGLIRLAAGTVNLDGAILANGVAGWNYYQVGGPGSGGGIRLDVATLLGAGRISANGGDGAPGTGSGGGGRVAIYYQTAEGYNLASNVTAHAGSGGSGPGSVGTVFLKSSAGQEKLLLASHATPASLWTPLGLPSDSAFQVRELEISGKGVVAAPAHQMPLRVARLSVIQESVLTHQPCTSTDTYSLLVTVTNDFVLDASSKIDVSGRGYLGNSTAQASASGPATGLSGASYGGLGLPADNGSPNSVYGDYRNPNEWGSGGAGDPTRTGAGGGLLRLTASTALIDGVVRADGADGWNYYQVGGPGSGGGIRLDIGTLSGTGRITANGGAGAPGTGSAGGGRVALYWRQLSGFDSTNNVTTLPGSGGNGPGAVGTVFLQAEGKPGQLVIDNHGTPTAVWTPLGRSTDTSFLVEHLLVSGTNVVVAPEHEMPVQALSVGVLNGASLTHLPTTPDAEHKLNLQISTSLFVDAASRIDVSGRGYLGNYTQGNSTAGAPSGTSGGSYGGLGGPVRGSANAVYGDFRNPVSAGTGGGGDSSRTGAGGGVIHISALDARIDGAVLANGAAGQNYYQVGGAGSGGSIRLDVTTLAGTGLISVDGGIGGSGFGAGSGGRAAIYYQNLQGFDLTNNVTAHGGGGGEALAALGTVYLKQASKPEWLLVASHGQRTAQWTPLGTLADPQLAVDQLLVAGTNVVVATTREMPIAAGSVLLLEGATLTHQPTSTNQEFSLRLTVTNSLVVDETASVDVSGRGYLANYTRGNTTLNGPSGFSGGSYGGLGSGQQGTANPIYGDYRNPNFLGSGGAGDPARAGAGGGLIRIQAGQALINGQVLANGHAGWNYYQNGGAGSGGSILLDAALLSGSGILSADGGAGGPGFGSGGGGRVAVLFNTLSNFDLATRVTARGGSGPAGSGAVGTVYLRQAGQPGELHIANLGSPTGSLTPLGNLGDSEFLAENLIISGTNTVAYPSGGMPIKARSLKLLDGAVLTIPGSTDQQVYQLNLVVTNDLVVDPASRIDVSGTGYRGNYTLGNRTNNASQGTSGASYGGLGYFQNGWPANPVYGDYRNPAEPGSGGAGDPSRTGAGGGLARIAAKTATIDGAVLANGVAGLNYYQIGGAGSGGGIRLDTDLLNGGGRILADGGNGGNGYGAGSGGRIALYCGAIQTFDLVNNVSAHGGSPGEGAGAVGTVFIKQSSLPGLLLLQSHERTAGMWTPLGQTEDEAFEAEDLVISGTNVVAAPEHEMRMELRTLTVTNAAMLTHRPTTTFQEYSLRLNIGGSLLVDETSRIDVSGRGYLANYTRGNSAAEGARGTSGASYGGSGVAVNGQPNYPYGDPVYPNASGSGGGGDPARAGSGGGIIHILSQSAQIDGQILANGNAGWNYYQVGGAGSGGSILVNAGDLSGAGAIRANGGAGGGGFGAGGGGRVALYAWSSMSITPTNVTADGGSGGPGSGGPGTVVLSDQPVFVWGDNNSFLHGNAPISWQLLGLPPGGVRVEIAAERGGASFPVGASSNSIGLIRWDSRKVADGPYRLRAVYTDITGRNSGVITRDVLVNNALAWHSGTVTNNETWSAGTVHAVEGQLFVAPGVTVTIQPGAIVKFTPAAGIVLRDSAVLNAPATPAAPIILTSFKDDSAGGDSNWDQDTSQPRPGDWSGVSYSADGQFNRTSSVEFRYLVVIHGGALASNESWEGTFIHYIQNTVTVPSGTTLTIAPGAVLKFAPGTGLNLLSGARLNALGTLAQPITFTSMKDDSAGGDSNNDADLSQPAPGDWVGLNLAEADANLRYTHVRYGGNTGSGSFTSGVIIASASKLAMTGCVVDTALYDGLSIYGSGGTANLTNCVLRELDRAIWGWSGGNVYLLNCTFDENVAALVQHGGSTITAENCVIANSVQGSVTEGECVLRYCNLWSRYPNSSNPNVIGQNGNLSTDPRFADPSRKDYRLRYGSPCIDGANSQLAPATDFMGAPRYTDPRAVNRTGLPSSSGVYADVGAYEFVENAASAIDLVVTSVAGPAQVVAGETATLSWTVANLGTGPAQGPWHDGIYLAPVTGGDPVFVADALAAEAAALAPGRTVQVTAKVRVTGAPAGQYRWQVQANSRGDIFEGANCTNNISQSSTTVYVSVPQLVLDAPALNQQFSATGQSFWFMVSPGTNADVQINLSAVAGAGNLELYLGRGYIPTRERFDAVDVLTTSGAASVLAAGASSQPWYITVFARNVSAILPFTVGSTALDFSITGVAPNVAGAGGALTLEISGGRLRSEMSFSLLETNGAAHPATAAWQGGDAAVRATFDATSLTPGVYSLSVRDGARSAVLPNALTLVTPNPGKVTYQLVMPNFIRWGMTRRAVLIYRNPGNTDVLAPVITIKGSQCTLTSVKLDTRTEVDFGGALPQPAASVQLLAINPDGPAGVLPPGFEGRFLLDVMANPGVGSVSLNVEEMLPGATMDWASWKTSLKPAFLPADAWDAVFANLSARLGTTTDQYRKVLSDDATYLSGLGTYTVDPGRLLAFEIQKANAFGSIGLRYAQGIFGRGFADPFNMTLQTDPQGNVLIGCAAGYREFLLRSAGVYQSLPGDAAVLTRLAEGYRLEEADGVVTVFNTAGKISYIEQPNSWRVTLNYVNGRLTGMSNSHGDSLTYVYNPQGRVSAFADSYGRTMTLTYDASGEHLLKIDSLAGRVHFGYVTGQGLAREHALSSVTYPDNRRILLEYDSQGRITRYYGEQNTGTLQFSYDTQAGILITDGAGGSFLCQFDDLQNLSTIRDPLGRRFTIRYDQQLTPSRLLDAAGNSQTMTHDAQGNLTGVADWMGLTYVMNYNAANTLTAFVNPAGTPVNFTFDAGRNLTGALYPDQTQLRFERDALGQLTAWTNRRGQTTRYDLGSRGQLLRKRLAGGGLERFSYDSRGNLLQAVDSSGTNTFTYDVANRLTNLRYASGHSLAYTYDAAGRRTSLTLDDGYIVNYSYDAGGRLSALRDKNNALIVSYTYDSADRLVREDKGNQTYTTYEYDAAGQVLHLLNRRNTGTVLSRYDYAYDLLGRPIGMATLDGSWSYAYDANGQMTQATLVSTNPAVASQDLQFTYDNAGNRTETRLNNASQSYLADNLDRYLASGTKSYNYDADGNLVSITDETGTTTLAYDELNRLVRVTSASDVWSYEYDIWGQVRATVHNGARTEYVLDPLYRGSVVGEYANGVLAAHYALGIGLAARVDAGGTVNHYHYDFVGNTSEITGPGGTVLNSYRYRPFGELLTGQEAFPNRFAYSGRWGVPTDANGLTLMGWRFYRAAEGRFITEEPIGRRYPNAYAYANNSPVLYNDPTGLDGQNGFVNWLISLIPFSSTFTGMHNTWTAGQQGHAEYQSNIDALASNPNAPLYGDSVNGGQVGGMYLPALQQAGSTVVNSQMNVVNQAFGSVQGAPPLASPLGLTRTGVNFGLNKMKNHYMNQKPSRKIGGGDGKTSPPGTPPGPPGGPSSTGSSPSGGSTDPNDLVGPAGFGEGRWIPMGTPMVYTIHFENLPTVLLPAQMVDIENHLQPVLDWTTFEFMQVGFNNVTIDIPAGLKSYTGSARVASDPNPVGIDLAFNPLTGFLKARLESQDTATGLLVEDPFAGFLPPNDAQHRGEGFLTYMVRTAAALQADALVQNQASIVFDVNAPLRTPVFTNRIDVLQPVSSVSALPEISTNLQFRVSWSGLDLGSGLSSFDVYHSINAGPWSLWQTATPATSALYSGQPGRTYAFYSVARDNVGQVELKAPHAEATTTVSTNLIPVLPPALTGFMNHQGNFELTFTGNLNLTNYVESSTNLLDWTMLAPLYNSTNSAFRYEDSQSKTLPLRYYRVRISSP